MARVPRSVGSPSPNNPSSKECAGARMPPFQQIRLDVVLHSTTVPSPHLLDNHGRLRLPLRIAGSEISFPAESNPRHQGICPDLLLSTATTPGNSDDGTNSDFDKQNEHMRVRSKNTHAPLRLVPSKLPSHASLNEPREAVQFSHVLDFVPDRHGFVVV